MGFFEGVLNAVYPCRCPYCGGVILRSAVACRDCAQELPKTCYSRCASGGVPCAAALTYTGKYADAVKRFKYGKVSEYTHPFANLVADTVIGTYGEAAFDLVTSVPMHSRDLRERQFDHAALIARAAARRLELPYAAVLEKHRKNVPQHTLKRSEREDNVRGVYRVSNARTLKGKRLLIVDDIITTGSTLGECAKTAQKGGCKSVACAVVATVTV